MIPQAGKLWWFDLLNGNILSCDPFSQQPRLRRVRVPGLAATTATLTSGVVVAKHRSLAPACQSRWADGLPWYHHRVHA